MPINLASFIQPRNGNSYFLLEDVYLKGGLQIQADHESRDAINELNRKAGMLVATQNDNQLWMLQADLVSWTPLKIGGGAGQLKQRNVVVATTAPLTPGGADIISMINTQGTSILSHLVVSSPCKIAIIDASRPVASPDSNPLTFVFIPNMLEADGRFVDSQGRLGHTDERFIISTHGITDGCLWDVINLSDTAEKITIVATFLVLESTSRS